MEKMSQEKTIAITRSKDDSEEFIQLITKHNAIMNKKANILLFKFIKKLLKHIT